MVKDKLKVDVMKMDSSVYLIPIMQDSQLVTIIDIPVERRVKKCVAEYPGYSQNISIFHKKKIGLGSTFMTQKRVSVREEILVEKR